MITVTIDPADQRELELQFKRLIAITKEPVEDILKKQGRLFAVDAARYTGRFGNEASVGRQHKEDIEKTVRRVYRTIGGKKNLSGRIKEHYNKGAQKLWNSAVRRKDSARLKELAIQFNLLRSTNNIEFIEWDRGRAHTKRLKGKSSGKVYYVFGPAKNINQYIARKKKEVGEAKSGWVKAARMLGHKGSKGTPQWMEVGHKTRGFGRVRGTGSKAELVVAHYGKYGFSKTSMKGVWRSRGNAIGKLIERMINSKSKKIVR